MRKVRAEMFVSVAERGRDYKSEKLHREWEIESLSVYVSVRVLGKAELVSYILVI
jgi:hypothetical protein